MKIKNLFYLAILIATFYIFRFSGQLSNNNQGLKINNSSSRTKAKSDISVLDVNIILKSLNASDKAWMPQKTSNGYRYLPIKGEVPLGEREIENRIKNFDKLFSEHKVDILNILDQLKLPYRKVVLCTSDMGFSAEKT